MAGVREELEFVAMKAVAIVGRQMNERDDGGDADEDSGIGPALAATWMLVYDG
jgi:hypothetical protein